MIGDVQRDAARDALGRRYPLFTLFGWRLLLIALLVAALAGAWQLVLAPAAAAVGAWLSGVDVARPPAWTALALLVVPPIWWFRRPKYGRMPRISRRYR